MRTYLVADEGALPVVLYQVPVVARATAAVEAAADDIIGSPEPGTTFVDGPFDPAYTSALLDLVITGGRMRGPGGLALGRPSSFADAVPGPWEATVLGGEQSNTSIVYHSPAGAAPVICKVFRQLQPGLNPDIELETALAAAGSPRVARAVGHVEGEWPDPATARLTVRGSLAFAQEFLEGAEDAWRVALHAAASGESFAPRAWELARATADVHRSLARIFPTRPADAAQQTAISEGWRRRLATAIAEVPALATLREDIDRVYDRALGTDWPALQRIHGDYHLGQVLDSPEHGWVLLDFEGEPLRPMAERLSPDLTLRDVAGMLRSFDYVAGSVRLDRPDRSADDIRGWVSDARRAFVDGYSHAAGIDLDEHVALLTALELDKAVYEAIYETRNRPTWVTIPLRAIARLVERATAVA